MQNKFISSVDSSRFSGSLVATLVLCAAPAFAQSTPLPPIVGVTAAEIQTVLQHKGTEGAGVDRQIKVADLGDYKLGVGVLYRGPTKPGAPVAAISHSKVTEAFYIISGSGTLVTGTAVDNDRAFPPETEFVRLAVGPSSGGVFKGGDRRPLAAGDVVIVPAGDAARLRRHYRSLDVSEYPSRSRRRVAGELRASGAEEVTIPTGRGARCDRASSRSG